MQKIHRFRDDLKLGDLGEKEFMSTYGFTKSPTYDYDFHCKQGVRYELKTDSWLVGDYFDYKNKITNNFFIERYIIQDDGAYKDGCIWTAYENADILIYYFRNSQIFYVFDIKTLVPMVEDMVLAKNIQLSKPIWNEGYYAVGYKINIKSLESIYDFYVFGSDEFNKESK